MRSLQVTTPGALIDLAGNDYLGLRTHPAVIEGAVAAARAHGGGAGASRLVSGTLAIHADLESALARLVGAPAALVCSTGYAANLAAVTALTDADTLIVSDAHAHASLIDGARLSKGTVRVVPHNDVGAVEEALRGRSQGRAVVLAESIYSVLGDAAPVAELVRVTAAHDAVLILDEAHALGVTGPGGGGLLAAARQRHTASGTSAANGAAAAGPGPAPGRASGRHTGGDLWPAHVVVTGTLSKALGSQGGVVLGHGAVREHLVNTARAFIYDTGLAPAAAGAALAALELASADPALRDRLRANAVAIAGALGIEAPAGAVMSVPMPGPDEALAAVARAAQAGVRIGCFRPPSTPDGISRLRLTARADLASEALEQALAVLASARAGQAVGS